MVAACFSEKPAHLQQGVGDLTSKEDRVDLCAWLPEHQGHDDAQDTERVVSQHQGPLGLEVDAPAQVEDEVAQGETQNVHLERSIGWAWNKPRQKQTEWLDPDALHQGPIVSRAFLNQAGTCIWATTTKD